MSATVLRHLNAVCMVAAQSLSTLSSTTGVVHSTFMGWARLSTTESVKARWKGHEGYASLGAYSFGEGETAKDAAEEFANLRSEALVDLNHKVEEAAGSLSELVLAD